MFNRVELNRTFFKISRPPKWANFVFELVKGKTILF